MQKSIGNLMRRLDVLIRDVLLYEIILRMNNNEYLRLHNRNEKIAKGPHGLGYLCLWPYTSRLYAPQVWSYLRRKLLRKVVSRSIFCGSDSLEHNHRQVEISVLIGHRGMKRLPHLLTTLSYIAAQEEISLECIVVEQNVTKEIATYLPPWVRYLFMNTNDANLGYNRSAAFNYAAKHANGKILLLHDNDMLIPKSYCRNIKRITEMGYEAVNPKRFVFYLNQVSSEGLMNSCH
jgi:hypothetical protein